MIGYSELKKGTRILMGGQPYELIETNLMFKGRGQSVLQARIKNLLTGEIRNHTFRPSDEFEEPDLETRPLLFLFSHREKYVFCEKDDRGKRYELKEEVIGESKWYLKPNLEVEGLFFEEKLINVILPIKVALKVVEAPPVVKGQSASGGTKPVKLETGLTIQAPLFVEAGDIIEVNTQTGEYSKRVG